MTNAIKLTKEQEADAWTLGAYMTLSSLESELQDVEDVIESGDTYKGIQEIAQVLRRAIEIIGG